MALPVIFGSMSLPSTCVSTDAAKYLQITGRPRKVQVKVLVTFRTVIAPFVFSVAESVPTSNSQGLVVEALVLARTELQMLELQPVNVTLLMLPTPVSPLVIVPPASEVVQVTVSMTFFSLLNIVKTMFPAFLPDKLPV